MTTLSKDVQKKYIEYQMTRSQFNSFLEEKAMLDSRMAELSVSISALKSMENIKPGTKMLFGLGSGVFLRGSPMMTEKFVVGVGAGIAVTQTRERSLEILQLRLDEINNLNNQIVLEINKLGTSLKKLENELNIRE